MSALTWREHLSLTFDCVSSRGPADPQTSWMGHRADLSPRCGDSERVRGKHDRTSFLKRPDVCGAWGFKRDLILGSRATAFGTDLSQIRAYAGLEVHYDHEVFKGVEAFEIWNQLYACVFCRSSSMSLASCQIWFRGRVGAEVGQVSVLNSGLLVSVEY